MMPLHATLCFHLLVRFIIALLSLVGTSQMSPPITAAANTNDNYWIGRLTSLCHWEYSIAFFPIPISTHEDDPLLPSHMKASAEFCTHLLPSKYIQYPYMVYAPSSNNDHPDMVRESSIIYICNYDRAIISTIIILYNEILELSLTTYHCISSLATGSIGLTFDRQETAAQIQ